MDSYDSSDIVSLVEDIRKAAVEETSATQSQASHPHSHSHLLSLIHQLRLAVETPTETVLRLIYQPPQNAALRTLIDLDVFGLLVAHGGAGLSAEELSSYTKAEKGLIVRLMRIATALGLVDSPEYEIYKPNSKTAILIRPVGRDGVRCIYDLTMPALSKLPAYFIEHNYTLPTEYNESPMYWATGQSQFEWLASHPHQQALFNSYMASRREGKPAWFDVYPVQRLLDCDSGSDSVSECGSESGYGSNSDRERHDAVFLVDIGGNHGHDLVKFRQRYPDGAGKLVLQDLPAVIEGIQSENLDELQRKGIKTMGYSFFDPQPVKGSQTYYFRSIFHDWPDNICLTILRNTISAMADYSRILIVDFVLPDTETPLLQASLDVQMMSIGSGVERCKAQWTELLEKAGLEIRGIWSAGPGMESVIEAGLAGSRSL